MENITIEQLAKALSGLTSTEIKTKKEKTPTIICNIDGELIEFKGEKQLKQFMWTQRPNKVLRYDLAGEVSVPFDLTTTPISQK